MTERYYGTTKKPKNPFQNCKTPTEVFHLSRRISAEMGNTLRRIGVVCNEEGQIQLKGDSGHKIFNLQKFIETKKKSQEIPEKQNKQIEKYYKRDYFLPFYDYLTAISNQNMQHQGIQLESLNGQRIFCRAGVISNFKRSGLPPTSDSTIFSKRISLRGHIILESFMGCLRLEAEQEFFLRFYQSL